MTARTTYRCEWFALCDNATDHYLPHPVLGPVPCCERCARIVGAQADLRPIVPGKAHQ